MKKENIDKKTQEQILEEAYTKCIQELIKLHILANQIVLQEVKNYRSFFYEQSDIIEKNLQKIEKNLNTVVSNVQKAKIDVLKNTQPTKQR